jgi:hypothetical protein
VFLCWRRSPVRNDGVRFTIYSFVIVPSSGAIELLLRTSLGQKLARKHHKSWAVSEFMVPHVRNANPLGISGALAFGNWDRWGKGPITEVTHWAIFGQEVQT